MSPASAVPLDVDDRVPRAVVRVGRDVGHVHHRPDRGSASVKVRDHLCLRSRAAHHSTMIASSASRCSIRPAKVVNRGSSPTPRSAMHACRHGVAARRHADPLPSRHRYVPRGTVYGRPRAEPGLHLAGQRVQRESGPMIWNIVSSRFTSTTWPTPRVQRDHRGERGGQAGDLVGQRDRGEQRLPVRLAADAQPARTSPRRSWRTRPLGVGAVLAEPGDPRDHERARCGRAARPGRARAAPACRGGSSRRARRRRRRGGAAASRSASVLEVERDVRLLRLTSFHHRPSPSRGRARPCCAGCRRSGRSTLITSAPKSARYRRSSGRRRPSRCRSREPGQRSTRVREHSTPTSPPACICAAYRPSPAISSSCVPISAMRPPSRA